MGQKAAGPGGDFSREVASVIRKAISSSDMTNKDVMEKSGVPANTFYTKMRGEKPFNLNELEKIARALDADPIFYLREATAASSVRPVAPIRPNVGGSAQSDHLQDAALDDVAATRDASSVDPDR